MGQIAERCTIGYFQALDTSNGRKFPPNELLSMFLVPMERFWVGLSENIYFYELLYIFLEDMSLKTSKIGKKNAFLLKNQLQKFILHLEINSFFSILILIISTYL